MSLGGVAGKMIHVWSASGEEQLAIPVGRLHNVRQIKQELYRLLKVPRFRQRLLHDSGPLDDDVPLEGPIDLQSLVLPFADSTEEQVKELTVAAANGDVARVERLLQRPQDPMLMLHGDPKTLPIWIANHYRRAEIVGLMIEAAVSPDLTSTSGDTLLNIACKHGNWDMARMLLEALADANLGARGFIGRTPLQVVCERKHVSEDVVRLLLTSRADVAEPLGFCCTQGRVEVLKLLLEVNSDIDRCNDVGETPLWQACEHGHVEAARLLLQSGAGRLPATHRCRRLLANHSFRLDLERLLLEAGGNTDWNNHLGELLLWLACGSGRVDLVRLLLQANADVGWCNHLGDTPLRLACELGHVEVERLLQDASGTYVATANMAVAASVDGVASHKKLHFEQTCFGSLSGCSSTL